MKFAITGSSGLVGSELIPFLQSIGREVFRVVRRPAAISEAEIFWDPVEGRLDTSLLDGFYGVVHLGGVNIADGRWSEKRKAEIRDSRVNSTRFLCESLAKMAKPPKVLVCASAVGFYGDRGDQLMTEESDAGKGFLADVCSQWEAATSAAADHGIRVVNLRIGVVLSPDGGALAKMLMPFWLGVGGVIGSGKQFMSWISINDVVGAINHSLMTESLAGPVNAVAPNPVTNHAFTKAMGKVLRRPTLLPMPGFGARMAFGEMADELLLASTRVEPARLLETKYPFRHPEIEKALRYLLGKSVLEHKL